MRSAAGTVNSATPTTIIATGNVDREGLGASSTPRMPPRRTITGALDMPRAMLKLRRRTFRFMIRLGSFQEY
jgi:hypothetical protein